MPPNASPTLLNLFFLSVMLGPSDPRAWKKAKDSARKSLFYKENREAVLVRNKKWKQENPALVEQQRRTYNQKNRQDHNLYLIEYKKAQRVANPLIRLLESLRTRLYKALRAQGTRKDKKTIELLGAPIAVVRQHLAGTFQLGMTWENYGIWHVDHIRPCASFDLSDPAQAKSCFHYTNLQALWAADNLKKGDRYDN